MPKKWWKNAQGDVFKFLLSDQQSKSKGIQFTVIYYEEKQQILPFEKLEPESFQS